MHSTMIGTIEKARRYTQEPERLGIVALAARFHGTNDDYSLTLADDRWRCGCHSFAQYGCCAHIMAVQRLLTAMLPHGARYEQTIWTADPGSSIIGKLAKARRYVEEPQRFALTHVDAAFHGSNDEHRMAMDDGRWHCACHAFEQGDICAHVIAAQRLLAAMLPVQARYEATALAGASA